VQDFILPVLFLLLPIAVWSGYKIGKQKSKKLSTHRFAPGYFTGLNFLLNEQPDKAIDSFIKMLQVDNETVETHLALGNLFRRRGEVDRALRIHQNLIARPSLTPEVRQIALLELANDYLMAGVLDRAENLFEELRHDPEHQQSSLKNLITIYQQTKDWQKAIQCCVQIEQMSSENKATVIAHYYCELAEEYLANSPTRSKDNEKSALEALKKAIKANRSSVRASIIEGTFYKSTGQYKKALSAFKRVRHQDISFLPEVLEDIVYCSKQLNAEKPLVQYLQQCREMGAGVSVILSLAEHLQSQDQDKSAADAISEHLRLKPSLKGLEKLIQIHRTHSTGSAKSNLDLLHSLVVKLMDQKPIYQCNECGFSGKTLFWQCPSCHEWGTMNPIIGIEGE